LQDPLKGDELDFNTDYINKRFNLPGGGQRGKKIRLIKTKGVQSWK